MADTGTPIYDALAQETGVSIPDPLESDPVHAVLAAVDHARALSAASGPALARLDAGPTWVLPVAQGVDPDRMPPEPGEHHHTEAGEAA